MKKFNLDQFIWFCILLMLSIVMTHLLISGDLFLLIDKGRILSTTLMMVILYLLTIVQISRIATIPSRNGVRRGYIQYIILIGILIVVAIIDIPRVSLDMKGVKLYHSEHKHGQHDTHMHGHINNEEEIHINSDNFHNAVEEMNAHIDNYKNKVIEVEGIYYKDKNYPDYFIITELNMNCCIADSQYIGILCDGRGFEDMENGDNIKVKGIISSDKIDDKEVIKIDIN